MLVTGSSRLTATRFYGLPVCWRNDIIVFFCLTGSHTFNFPMGGDYSPPRGNDLFIVDLIVKCWSMEGPGRGSLEAELEDVEAQIVCVQHELDSLLQRQEELLERKRMSKGQIDSNVSIKKVCLQADWENGKFPWTERLRESLESIFKLESFRPLQLSSVNATLSGNDCVLIMPTGGGKSLCYQLPACLSSGITLVVSPLVSLMQDQLLAVKSLGIEASLLNASSTREEINRVHKSLTSGTSSLKILYVTPEKIAKSKRFMSNLQKAFKLGNLSRIVIDEVHCASQWGHDFRPDYKRLRILKSQFPKIPILGLTATATSRVLTEVKEILCLKQCLIFRASYNRPNLFYVVKRKSSSAKEQLDEIAQLIKGRYPNQSGIVYCFSRKDCDQVSSGLAGVGIKAGCYHSDLHTQERNQVHMQWLNGTLKVIVATIAFGMGIDKPDVRYVIHHSLSKSMENYYQESGRAGRDGNDAHCIIFFRAADVFRQSTMVFSEQTGLQNLYSMVRYCLNEVDCRRLSIAHSFGEKWSENDCSSACDVCQETNPVSADKKGVVPRSGQEMFMESSSMDDQPCTSKVPGGIGHGRFIEEDISEYCRGLIEIVEHALGNEKRLTAQKLLESWRGQGATANRLSHIPIPKFSIPMCESIILQAIVSDVLKENFHFTPYTTISYVGLGYKSAAVKKGVLIVSLKVKPTVSCNKVLKSSSALRTKGRLAFDSEASTVAAGGGQVSNGHEVIQEELPVKESSMACKLPKMYLSSSDSEGDDFLPVLPPRRKRLCTSDMNSRPTNVIEIVSD